ncbi:beta-bisabolene synthase-like [Punica granatum]|uniref:Beta-bisabolene synthase-like n=2 Tax=Punica granatum TaxID=22663 RepID=A0A6P8DHV2_PUNGR|nr:beta-bisabolene synthase-like [Punica granatum]
MALQAIFFTQSQLLIDPLSRIPCSLRSNPFQALTSHAYARAAHQTIVCTSETWNPTITASSASTKPRTWDYGIVPSLSNTEYTEKEWAEEVQTMGDDVRVIMNKKMEPLEKLELIDAIQRLGLEYHFKMEIEHSLKSLYESAAAAQHEYDDLYSAALRFRIFRQHHYYEIPQDVFRKFIDSETGNFRSVLANDVKGLLSLYEASFLGFKGEVVMDKALAFSTAHLKEKKKIISSPDLAVKVEHALDMPIHWRPNRLEARWFMEVYEEQPDMNPNLLKLAKLDYNIVQLIHREEFGRLVRWWTELGLGNMTFFRDNLVEHCLWTSLVIFDPKYSDLREMTTKVVAMITLIDDVYDLLGTLEELELLTHLINQWDITKIDELPLNMATCFVALYNITNEIGLWAMTRRGINIIPYMREAWSDQCKAYLEEAKWCQKHFMPTLKEYLSSAVRSVGVFLTLQCCFLITTDNLTEDALNYIVKIPSIVRCSSLLIRLNNDLVPTAVGLAEGDKLNSLECFMNETGASEEQARGHIKDLVHKTWKTLNKDVFNDSCQFSGPFVTACLNAARASHWIYRYGDGHGIRSQEAKEHLMSALVQPIPIEQLDHKFILGVK